jgi:hypothetical protein
MVVGFTTYAISATKVVSSNPAHGEMYSIQQLCWLGDNKGVRVIVFNVTYISVTSWQ